MKPNFLIIGAARSGTTSLHKYLEAHPDVFMSEIKEINYFSNPRYWRKGEGWYLRHFQSADHQLVGEASTSYTSAPSISDVPRRIHDLLGDIKLIYIIRDPIDRLISHYQHRVNRGLENRSLHVITSGKADHLLWQGRYAYQIEQYLEFFSFDNIMILTLDELKDDSARVLLRVSEFLRLQHGLSDKPNRKFEAHNARAGPKVRSLFGRRILRIYHSHVEQRRIPYRIKRTILRAADLGARPGTHDCLRPQEIEDLRKFYAADVETLSKRFGVDVSHWRNYD